MTISFSSRGRSPPSIGLLSLSTPPVTHHFKDGQLDLEFDSSAAKLVNLVAILAQLVSPSVALPAQLVNMSLSPIYLRQYINYDFQDENFQYIQI